MNTQTHEPVLCEETIELVIPLAEALQEGAAEADGAVYLDATFGRGGHSLALLRRLGERGRVIATDRDPEALAAGRKLAAEEPRLSVHHARFSELATVLDALHVDRVTGVIMDLGVSSPQLDDPERGFSFRAAGPIDMRMDPSAGTPAADWLNSATAEELADVLRRYGEERFAGRISRALVQARPFTDTRALADVIRQAVPTRPAKGRGGASKSDAATRSFQAIRIHVNEELEEIEQGIRAAFARLAPGGRIAVISFHSLEDRTVKRIFRALAEGPRLPRNLPVRASEAAPKGRIVGKAVRPGDAELQRNPRSRSATLRVLERAA
ncbi:MAG: 16S rRNA (cytosine(1402)-N(4))-methyltransferase RsmH [Pseudomonadota bacterium]